MTKEEKQLSALEAPEGMYEKYDVEKEGLKWIVDNSVYPEQGYYIPIQDERRNDYR